MSSPDSTIVRLIDTIKKSDSDPWDYRGIELSNGMFCVLISHPHIDKAAAALDVSIGSLAEPSNVPGIAHFLEHMLFMGSSKYPGENEYQKLIEGNGGYSNASTSDDHTNYYFDIHPNLLSDALNIFGQFFISPLLGASSIDRELEAVNSEYEGNLFNDGRRLLQLDKSTSDPEHPYSRFTCGSTESLRTIPKQSGIDIGQVLVDFYNSEYSSNRMSLAVLGNQSLDELQSLVVKTFKDVPNKNLSAQKYPSDPYGEKNLKTICYVVPVNDSRSMSIDWVVPDYKEFYYCDPGSYLCGVMGHEGEGSILSYLKKLGLATAFMAGGTNGSPGFNFFSVNVTLTIDGLERWEETICIIYQYIAMLRKEGPKEWIFNECKNLNAMNFQFSEKEEPKDFVSNLAGRMRDFPLTECLSGPYEMREFRPDLICEMIDTYLIPSKMRVSLISKTFSTIATEKEKWFGAEYKQDYLPEEFIKKLERCQVISEVYLPSPNEFIPTDFLLYSNQDEPLAQPQLPTKIKENEYYRLFYAEDSFYKLPKAFIYFSFRNPLASVNPIHTVMKKIYTGLIDDSLTEFVYPANLGGLEYLLMPQAYNTLLTISGYNHKIRTLLEKIIDRMINIKVNPQQFEIIKENVKRSLQNLHRRVPYEMAKTGINYLTAEHDWTGDELLSCIDGITVQAIESFIPYMFTNFYIDSLMYGNLTKDQSIEYMTILQEKFEEKRFYQPLYPSMWFNRRNLCLPEGCNSAYKMLNDAYHVNAIEIYFQCFQQSLENEALLELFCHLVDEPCFDQLRTKEQLGYVVSSGVRCTRDVQGFRVIVQSSHGLESVDQRIELFIDSIRNYIETMSDELFHKLREGCINNKMEISKEMKTQGKTFWYEITIHQFCFDRSRLEVEIMKKLERNDLIRFYEHFISPSSPSRRKLALHVNPSPLAFKTPREDEHLIDKKNTLPEETEKGDIQSESTTEDKLNEERPIIDPEIQTNIQNLEKTLETGSKKYEELHLPKIEWIDNVHVWKSKLSCYPIAQSYSNIHIPNLYKL